MFDQKNKIEIKINEDVLQRLFDQVTEIEEDFIRNQEIKDEKAVKSIRALIKDYIENLEK